MSYTPTTWQTGDTITAEKLNHMEDGIENANEPFVVTLTPTAEDFSGTMDKTVAEINTAYEAGQKIKFKVLTGQDTYTLVPLSNVDKLSEEYPGFSAYVIDVINNILIVVWTSYTDDGTKQTYSTTIYTLTPMS